MGQGIRAGERTNEGRRGFQGKLADPAQLKACFQLEDDLSLKVERLYVYANMKHHEDTAEPGFQALSEKSKKLSVETGEALSFITPEVLGLSDDALNAMIENPDLAKYKQTLEEMRRQKAHVLPNRRKRCLRRSATSAKRRARYSAC